MKKLLTLTLTILLCLSVFAGCNIPQTPDDSNTPEPPKDVIGDYDNENEIEVDIGGDNVGNGNDENNNNDENENESDDENKDPDKQPEAGPEHTNTTGKFLCKDKKYVYEGANVTILHLENQSDEYFTITINGEYLDENGEVLKTETQTFEGFPGLWQNYFVFKPDIVYDDFRYTLSAIKYSGEKIFQQSTRVHFLQIKEDKLPITELFTNVSGSPDFTPDFTYYPAIISKFQFFGMPKDLMIQSWMITFDNQGEIYHIQLYSKFNIQEGSTVVNSLKQTTDKKIVWPEELVGGGTGIGGVYRIVPLE